MERPRGRGALLEVIAGIVEEAVGAIGLWRGPGSPYVFGGIPLGLALKVRVLGKLVVSGVQVG